VYRIFVLVTYPTKATRWQQETLLGKFKLDHDFTAIGGSTAPLPQRKNIRINSTYRALSKLVILIAASSEAAASGMGKIFF